MTSETSSEKALLQQLTVRLNDYEKKGEEARGGGREGQRRKRVVVSDICLCVSYKKEVKGN